MSTLLEGASIFVEAEGEQSVRSASSSRERLGINDARQVVVLQGNSYERVELDAADDIIVADKFEENYLDAGNGNNIINLLNSDDLDVYGGDGNDIINSMDTTEMSIYAGAGNDLINISGDTGNNIHGEDGNDIIKVKGGAEYSNATRITAGAGNDIISITDLDHDYVIDNSTASAIDRDILALQQYNKNEFTCSVVEGSLVMEHSNGATITVEGWEEHKLAKVLFKDGAVNGTKLGIEKNGVNETLQVSFDDIEANGSMTLDLDGNTKSIYDLVFADETSYKDAEFAVEGKDLIITLRENSTTTVSNFSSGDGIALLGAPVEQTVTKSLILRNYMDTASEKIVFKDGNTCIYKGKLKRGGNDDSGIGDQVDYDNMHGYLRYFFTDTDWYVNVRDYGENVVFDLTAYKDYVFRYTTEGFSGTSVKLDLYNASDKKVIGSIVMENAYDLLYYSAKDIRPNIRWNKDYEYNQYPYAEVNGVFYPRNYIAADNLKTKVSAQKEVVYGHNGNDIIEVTGDYNKIYGNDGDDVVYIKGNKNIVYGGEGSDVYYIDLKNSDNTEIELGNKDRIVFQNATLKDVLVIYSKDTGILQVISDNGNVLIIRGWEGENPDFSCDVFFDDEEYTATEITKIGLNSKKAYEINGAGDYKIPSNYSSVVLRGEGWNVRIPKYRLGMQIDLSQLKDFYFRYTTDCFDGTSVTMEVFNSKDNTCIGKVIMEDAYSLEFPAAMLIWPNIKLPDGVNFSTVPYAEVNGVLFPYDYLCASEVKTLINGKLETVQGHMGNDIIDVVGEFNKIYANDGDDIIYITGSNNRVNGGSGKDTYYIDLKKTCNTTLEFGSKDKLVFDNSNLKDILVAYSNDNGMLDFVADNGNFISVIGWDNKNPDFEATVVFSDGEYTAAEITEIGLKSQKVFEVNGKGNFTIPANYTNICLKGSDWNIIIPNYRYGLQLDLSQLRNFYFRYTTDGFGGTSLTMEVFNSETNELIGKIEMQNAYDIEVYSAKLLYPNIKLPENINFIINPYAEVNGVLFPYTYLCANNIKTEISGMLENVFGNAGDDVLEITGKSNKIYAYDGDDIINIKADNNYIEGGNGRDIYVVDLNNVYDTEIRDYDKDNSVVLSNVKSTDVQYTYNEELCNLYLTYTNGNYIALDGCSYDNQNNYILTFTDKTLNVKQAIDIANQQFHDISNKLNITISGYYEVADDVTDIYVDGNIDGKGETIRATISNLDERKTIDIANYQDGEFILSFVTDKSENRVELQVQKVDENGILGTCVALRFENSIIINEDGSLKVNVGGITYYDTATEEIKTLTQLNFDKDGRYIINGTENVDLLYFGGMANVHAGAGDDVIRAYTTDNKVIYGEAGNDTIRVYDAENVLVDGGIGNDIITVTGSENAAIIGDAGNDTISISGVEYVKLAGGAGEDSYVVDFSTTWSTIIDNASTSIDSDVLEIANTNLADVDIEWFTTTYEGEDNVVCLRIQDKTYLDKHIDIMHWDSNPLATIKFADRSLTAAELETMAGELGPQEINGSREVIKSFMGSLDNTTKIGFKAMDEAVVACSGGRYESLEELVEEFKTACMTKSGSTVEEMKAFLLEYCGVNMDDLDTGAIIGSNAGGKVDLTSESIVTEPEGMTPKDLVYNYEDFDVIKAPDWYKNETRFGTECYAAKVNNINFYWTEERWDEIVEQGSEAGLTRDILETMTSGVINAWAKPSLDLILNSTGLKLDSKDTTLNRLLNNERSIQLEFEYNPESDTLAYVKSRGSYYSDNPTVINRTLEVMVINTAYYTEAMSDINGTSYYGGGELDRIIAHELTHGVMAANIARFENLPLFLIEGMAELIHGVDDFRYDKIMDLVDTNFSGENSILNDPEINQEMLLDLVFNLKEEYCPVETYTYAGGYLLLRYMAKQCADSMTTEELLSLNMPKLFSTALGEEWTTEAAASSVATTGLEELQSAMLTVAEAPVFDSSSLDFVVDNDDKKEELIKVNGNC